MIRKGLKEDNLDSDIYLRRHFDDLRVYVDDSGFEIKSFIYSRSVRYFLNGKVIPVSIVNASHSLGNRELLSRIMADISEEEIITLSDSVDFDDFYRKKEYFLEKGNVKVPEFYDVRDQVDIELMYRIYTKFIRHFNGFIVRSLDDMYERFSMVKEKGGSYILYYRSGELKGYAEYYPSKGEVLVREIVYFDSLGFMSIVAGLFEKAHGVRIRVSERENLSFAGKDIPFIYTDQLRLKINDLPLLNKLYGTDVTCPAELKTKSALPFNIGE